MARMSRIRNLRSMAVDAPRIFLSIDDWITLLPALAIYLAVAVSVQ